MIEAHAVQANACLVQGACIKTLLFPNSPRRTCLGKLNFSLQSWGFVSRMFIFSGFEIDSADRRESRNFKNKSHIDSLIPYF